MLPSDRDVTTSHSHPGLQQIQRFTDFHTDFLILGGKWHLSPPASVTRLLNKVWAEDQSQLLKY